MCWDGDVPALDEIVFRPYRTEDLGKLVALDEACFERPFRFSRAAMRLFVEAQNAWAEVAVCGDEVLAFCIAHREQIPHETVGYLVTIDVAPQHRRRGLARRLIEDAQHWLRHEGATALLLHVYGQNDEAVQFYASLGFRRGGEQPGFYGPGLDALLYWKQIDH